MKLRCQLLPAKPAIALGRALFFDRRLWHSASANYWDVPRRVLFYGYSYRWLRPRDDMTVDHYLDKCDPIVGKFQFNFHLRVRLHERD